MRFGDSLDLGPHLSTRWATWRSGRTAGSWRFGQFGGCVRGRQLGGRVRVGVLGSSARLAHGLGVLVALAATGARCALVPFAAGAMSAVSAWRSGRSRHCGLALFGIFGVECVRWGSSSRGRVWEWECVEFGIAWLSSGLRHHGALLDLGTLGAVSAGAKSALFGLELRGLLGDFGTMGLGFERAASSGSALFGSAGSFVSAWSSSCPSSSPSCSGGSAAGISASW